MIRVGFEGIYILTNVRNQQIVQVIINKAPPIMRNGFTWNLHTNMLA